MKEFTIEEIIDYADKLLIGLSKEEASSIKEEFSCIDKNIDKINNIPNLQNVTPSAFPFNLYAASLREDVAEPSVPVELLLANDKDVEGREVKVPKVVN